MGSGLWPGIKQTEPEPELSPSALEPALPAQLFSAECAMGALENRGCLGETQPSPAAPHEADVEKCQAGIMELSLGQRHASCSSHVDAPSS